jgi:hypothetical protein
MVNNNQSEPNYDDFLEIIKMMFGEFLRFAEAGKTNRHRGMKARKISMKLRELLKEFRPKSIEQEKKITQIMQHAKEDINKM